MHVIGIINAKGGTGKTTTSAALAQVFATKYNKRVLLIDADPQNDLSAQFGHPDSPGMDWVMIGDYVEGPLEVIQQTAMDNVTIVPYTLYGLELAGTQGKQVDLQAINYLTMQVAEADAADMVIIDCPPHFTPTSVAALLAATDILIPTTPDAHSVAGMSFLFEQIKQLRGDDRPLKSGGIFLTMWERTPLIIQVEGTLRKNGWPVLRTHIRRSPKALESTYATGEAVSSYSKRSSAGRDYVELAEELMIKWGET